MMDYSKMSDFEINKAVAIARGTLIRKGKSLSLYQVEGLDLCTDFCNSWADAGPIIQQNNISLLKCERMDEWVAGSSYWVGGAEWSVDWLSDDKNPLRAAMIVYLMMHDKGEE